MASGVSNGSDVSTFPYANMATTDAVGYVAVIDLQHHGSEFYQRNVLSLSGLQMQWARPFVQAF
jgi:hypothetical protein